ncbi:MAG: hypothetical protein M0R68_15315 [Bacteroidetes bacterium]|nr:hypothetical protein [Bacteroidota bacterium]
MSKPINKKKWAQRRNWAHRCLTGMKTSAAKLQQNNAVTAAEVKVLRRIESNISDFINGFTSDEAHAVSKSQFVED